MNFNEPKQQSKRSFISYLAAITFVVFIVGTAAIPAVLAILYRWEWLFVYPACLAVTVIYASSADKEKRS